MCTHSIDDLLPRALLHYAATGDMVKCSYNSCIHVQCHRFLILIMSQYKYKPWYDWLQAGAYEPPKGCVTCHLNTNSCTELGVAIYMYMYMYQLCIVSARKFQ